MVKNLPAGQEPEETQVWSLGRVDLLKKGMATNSSILAWRIQKTGACGLQSIGLQRVECNCNWSDLAHTHLLIFQFLPQTLQMISFPTCFGQCWLFSILCPHRDVLGSSVLGSSWYLKFSLPSTFPHSRLHPVLEVMANACLLQPQDSTWTVVTARAIYKKLYACLGNGSNLYTIESGNDFNKGTLYVRKSVCI